MENIKAGDLVKHKTISWMNGGKPFRVVKIEDGKAFCEYTGRNGVQCLYDFYVEQLLLAEPVSLENN